LQFRELVLIADEPDGIRDAVRVLLVLRCSRVCLRVGTHPLGMAQQCIDLRRNAIGDDDRLPTLA
jgi:hypothetical protein